ncbi:hypothetical protein KGA66_05970 [Actinocrinis puniceicyclus]|uniref:SHOCT domain-containing protein n=1 Tax=Actinocrinis puniceicyclus TaxID=977794 RepID=A0A8J7WKK8_9ACTN|nr:hypothetical protein [Actinocrinis puniceicyclus]MBS2962585.1 hypothetical protein [Actinocrinis puniceicyclus]
MNGAGIGIIIGLVLILVLTILWYVRAGNEADQRAATARAAGAGQQPLGRTDPDHNLAQRAREFGVVLDLAADTVSVAGQARGRFTGSVMRIETEGQLTSRITVTRLVTLGVFALGARKKIDNRELYLTVEGDGFQLVRKIAPTLGDQARRFVAAYNTRSGALAKQPAAGARDLAGELERLAKLHSDGGLSDREFVVAKARLLAQPEGRRP